MTQPLIPLAPPPAKSNGAAVDLQLILAAPTRLLSGLYVHVPFCFHKCHYCDFYSIVDDRRQDPFTDRLVAELDHRAGQTTLRPDTLFIGGGTPTLLRPDLWRRLLEALRRQGILENLAEFTVEANPETVTADLMEVLVGGGVNRISIGAQSFQGELLKALERWHEPASVERSVRLIRQAGIANFNLDLIFAIPGQTLAALDADLDAALALGPTHLSCYGLTYEPNTAMTQRLRAGQVARVPEEMERRMYARVIERLAAAGFEHYEVSAWARRGPTDRRCRHNLGYWTNRNWLGLGPGAASHFDGHRWKNQPHLGRYLAAAGEPPLVEYEHLPAERRAGEELMLRLRLREGVPLDWLAQHLPPADPRWTTLSYLESIGMVERAGPRLRLTGEGLFVADAVIQELL